jgi:DNA-binding HxlR family transcriptional regulator
MLGPLIKTATMKTYGQFCPIAKTSEVISERWTLLVIRELGAGSETFNDLRRGLPLMSPSLLSARLKSLEKAGVVERDVNGKAVRYKLAEAGRELKPIILAMGTWGHRWARSKLEPEDLDPSLLMWDIHRTMNGDYFGPGRAVLQFEFRDYAARFKYWWLLIEDGDVDVCMKDPGYEVDLQVLTDVRTLTGIWMGDIKLGKAVRDKTLKVSGPDQWRRDIAKWLGTNHFASVAPAPFRQPRSLKSQKSPGV